MFEVSNKSKLFGSASQASSEVDGNVDVFAKQSDKFTTDPFWDFAATADLWANWNKLFPYQLLVIERVKGSYSAQNVRARFTLPFPPQEQNMSTPFAIETSVTMGGVIEEHNGAPLRMISLTGTTGILPLRGTTSKASDLNSGASIFAGTVTGINEIKTAISQTSNLLGLPTSQPNVISEADAATLGSQTGFTQFQLLKRFLEAYVAVKKTAAGRNYRLAYAIHKEQEVYLVTPVSFDTLRSAASPLEFSYRLQLKAWRRIVFTDATQPFRAEVGVRDPNKLAQLVNTLESGRRILEGVRHTLEGIRADIQNILMTPLRQVILFTKDLIGVVLTAVDLPTDIVSDLREPLLELAAARSSIGSVGRLSTRFSNNGDAAVVVIKEAFAQLAVSSGKADTESGQDSRSRKDGILGTSGQNGRNAAPANKIMGDPTANFAFFSTVRPSDLNLRPDTIRKIEEERRKVRNLRREDFELNRDNILRVLADFSDFVGVGHAAYTSTYNLPVRSTNRVPTDDDWDIIHSLSRIAQQFDTLAATADINQDQISSMDFVAGLASRSGIAFRIPRSKFAVGFPYGYTLERLAERYLKDANRWHEIAALNGLRAPYVDELGFKLSFLANGNGNQITVNSADNLFVGQLVWLSSSATKREKRRIQKITKLSPTQYAVVVDGAKDLVKYTTAAGAFLQAFLPDTVNSQMQIYIPSDIVPDEDDFRVKTIPGVDYFDPLVRSGGIDLLLTNDGDLVITPDGDSRLAIGLTNLVQKVRLALGTARGSLLHHPDYGLGLRPGVSTADLSAQDVLSGAQALFKKDQGFTGIESASIRKTANSLFVRLNVGIAGSGHFVPIETEIRR
jgi:hypothetical protein